MAPGKILRGAPGSSEVDEVVGSLGLYRVLRIFFKGAAAFSVRCSLPHRFLGLGLEV